MRNWSDAGAGIGEADRAVRDRRQPVRLDPDDPDHHLPVWSPSSDAIAYRRENPGRLFVRSVNGGPPVELASSLSPLDWSRDGRWILGAKSGSRELVLVSPDGKRQEALPGQGEHRAAAFSPDSRAVYAYRRDRETGRWLLDRFDVATLALRGTVPLPVPEGQTLRYLHFHPDGKRFLAALQKTSRDIVILENLPHGPNRLERLFHFLPAR